MSQQKLINKSNKIIGAIYCPCITANKCIYDMAVLMAHIVLDCGSNYNLYLAKSNQINISLRAIILSFLSYPENYILFNNEDEKESIKIICKLNIALANVECNGITKEFRKNACDVILNTLGEMENETILNEIKEGIVELSKKQLPKAPNFAPIINETIAGIYTLFKFLIAEHEDFVETIKNLDTLLGSSFIGTLVGYKNIFAIYPFFEGRDYMNTCLKVFLNYLSGERRRVKLGDINITNGGRIYKGTRYMHMTDEPSVAGMYEIKNLPDELNTLSKLRRVSYIECGGRRFPTAEQFAKYYINNIRPEFVAQLIKADKEFINIGINAKLADEIDDPLLKFH